MIPQSCGVVLQVCDGDADVDGWEFHSSEDRSTGLATAWAYEFHELDITNSSAGEQRVAVAAEDPGTDDGPVDDLVAESARHEGSLIAKRGAYAPVVDFLEADKISVEFCARLEERAVIDVSVLPCAMPDVERRDAQPVVSHCDASR